MTHAMTAMPKYESYKDSGFEWIREIPEHWKVEKGKRLFKKESRPVQPNDDVITCFRDGEVTLRKNRRTDGFTNALQEIGYQRICEGDLVIHAMDAFAGAIGVSDSNGKSSPVYSACTPLKPDSVDPYYYAYFLRDLALSGVIVSLAKGIRERSTDFRFNDFGSLQLSVPPLNEQRKIVAFLDEKTVQIDEAIGIKEQQIALLKERKQIIIQNAVTKGLNPSAPLKDSGVDWIGDIPAHWDVKRFCNIFKFGKGLTITKENLQDTGVPCVNYGEIHSKYGFEVCADKHELKCVDTDYLRTSPKSLLKQGDFIFADTSEDLEGSGNFTYISGERDLFAGYHTITARLGIQANSRFLAYLFSSEGHRNQIRQKVKGVKVYSITQSILKDVKAILPSLEEQSEIVALLDIEAAKIDNAAKLQQAQINNLKEYKASLINSAVTGKIKVI